MLVGRGAALVLLLGLAGLCAAALPIITTHCGTDDAVTISETRIDGYVDTTMGLQWLTNEVVYVRSVVHDSGNVQSILYRSTDGGKSWTNEMNRLKNSQDGVYQVLPTAADGKAWILGFGQVLWGTTDAGASYQVIDIPDGERMAMEIYPHPYLSDYALIITQTNGETGHYDSLYSTTNFGATWTLVDTYVSFTQWAVEGLSGGKYIDNNTVIWTAVVASDDRKSSQPSDQRTYGVYRTSDFGKSKALIRSYTPALLVHNDVFFIAGWEKEATSPLTLYVSMDGGTTFTACVFPHSETLSELNYIILDALYGSAVVFILHSQRQSWGNVYQSDAFDRDFSLSLSFVVSYSGIGSSFPEWMAVERLPGVYMANVWDVGTGPGPISGTGVITLATRDNGASWNRITPPRGSSCGGAKTCYLNLRGPRTDIIGAFYSDADAVGLVVANGNVGDELDQASDDPTTYISRDGGITWFAIEDTGAGAKTYEWADHGALFLSATTDDASRSVYYSLVEGANIVQCNYTGDNLNVKRIIADLYNDPKMETASFIATASRSENRPSVDGDWVLLHFNFSAVYRRFCTGFHDPDSDTSDYERWSPADATCQLGQHSYFVRRKQFASCFNGHGYEVPENVTNCECTLADFRCAPCYIYNGTTCNLNCSVAPEEKAPENCVVNYFSSPGWEKIPLDQCVGAGPSSIGKMLPCPTLSTTHAILIVILILVFLIMATVGGCWALATYNPTVREFWSRTVPGLIAPTFGRTNSSTATYSLLKKPDSMDDDEEALSEDAQAKVLDDDTIVNFGKDKKGEANGNGAGANKGSTNGDAEIL